MTEEEKREYKKIRTKTTIDTNVLFHYLSMVLDCFKNFCDEQLVLQWMVEAVLNIHNLVTREFQNIFDIQKLLFKILFDVLQCLDAYCVDFSFLDMDKSKGKGKGAGAGSSSVDDQNSTSYAAGTATSQDEEKLRGYNNSADQNETANGQKLFEQYLQSNITNSETKSKVDMSSEDKEMKDFFNRCPGRKTLKNKDLHFLHTRLLLGFSLTADPFDELPIEVMNFVLDFYYYKRSLGYESAQLPLPLICHAKMPNPV